MQRFLKNCRGKGDFSVQNLGLFFQSWYLFPLFLTKAVAVQEQPPQVFCKKSHSWKFYKFHKKTPVLEFRLATSLKIDSITGVSLWNSRNFKEQLLWRTSVNDASCHEIVEKWNTRLSPETESTSCLTNCERFKT